MRERTSLKADDIRGLDIGIQVEPNNPTFPNNLAILTTDNRQQKRDN
jgi:hypothetical protein